MKNLIAAVFTNGSSQNTELQLLSSTTLAPLGKRYPLSSMQPLVVLSNSQSQLLVAERNNAQAIILDSDTLTPPRTSINKNNIQSAVFANNDRELIISDGSQTLSWFDLSNATSPAATLDMSDNVLRLASDPSGQLSAVQTANHIYLIDNQTRHIIKSEPYSKSFIYGMSMLSDKIIISRSGGPSIIFSLAT